MSSLDQHVAAVQNRLALGLFLKALGWLSAALAAVVWMAVLVDKLLGVHPPRPVIWIYFGAALVVSGAFGYALYKRPGQREAAIPIDLKLGLKEKISSALYIRNSKDPFAQATVMDAEFTARNVALNLGQHFPLRFPKPAYATIALALAAMMSTWIHPIDLLGKQQELKQQADRQVEIDKARQTVEKALASVVAIPKVAAEDEAIKLAKAELQAMLSQPIVDPNKANRTAVKALQDVQQALKEQIKNNAKFAEAQSEAKLFRSMQKPIEGQGPIADAHRAIVEGKFTDAIDDLTKAIENFDKMDKAQQQQAAQQMQQMAQQLQQMAQNNPQQEQKMQQQLQQAGLNQQQAQQAQQLMKQAAQGDKQAQQQLQQMAQQAQQQMNPQQQQQAQQMMQQMQAQANAQQQAQQMAQAAQQMAQAMQQGAQQQQQQGQQQGQQGQQKQPGQQQGQQQNQGMQQAMGQMQQQMQQMQAAAQDAQQIAAAQAAAQAAQGAAQNAMNGNNAGGQQGQQGQAGQWANNQQQPPQQWQPNQQPGNGQAGGGIGSGDRTFKQQAPFSVKPEISPSQDDDKGRILASNLIKDYQAQKGQSSEALKEMAERVLNEPTDEVDQERISRPAQNAVRDYFRSMTKDNN